ncbi:HAD family phosphatase [Lacticaseibacillus chiayiensis]|uniref:Cof-type HAD-IIB family hydrolase n=1 Tax=Lacticaseibacillus chiayiensis TaxID=2100821 RepID=UPI001BCB968A|nr:Cof-type HAD-IIB family hydrolase [Lacticaseibacillus chiayiensis]QVI35555.1 HAD family phosphatase [Lacticaseibacillus chiayiensis]
MRYRLILSDIDGTLLNSQHQLTAGVKQAIQAYVAAGGIFVLASARPPLAMTALARQMGLAMPLVSLNGALIGQSEGEQLRILAATSWPEGVGPHVYHALSTLPLTLNVFSGTHWYVVAFDKWTDQEAVITDMKPTTAPIWDMLINNLSVQKMLCMGDPAMVDKAEKIILAHPEWQLVASRSKSTYLEIVRQGVSKKSALQTLSSLYNVPISETMALGDGENDLPMLQAAGLGVTLANALPQVSAVIKTVVPDNDHDGAAVAIQRYAMGEAQ